MYITSAYLKRCLAAIIIFHFDSTDIQYNFIKLHNLESQSLINKYVQADNILPWHIFSPTHKNESVENIAQLPPICAATAAHLTAKHTLCAAITVLAAPTARQLRHKM